MIISTENSNEIINSYFAGGLSCVGCNYAHGEEMLSILNVLVPDRRTFAKSHKKVRKICERSMRMVYLS